MNQKAFTLQKEISIATATTTYTEEVRGFDSAFYLVVDVTARTAAQTLDIDVEIYDEASDSWVEVDGIAAALAAVATSTYLIGADTDWAGSATEILSMPLPRIWRLKMTTSDANNITFTIRAIPVGR